MNFLEPKSLSQLTLSTLAATDDGMATLHLQRTDNTINRLDFTFGNDLFTAVDALNSWHSKQPLKGVILHNAVSHFMAGADLNLFHQPGEDERRRLSDFIDQFKANLRQLETLGCPVVACIQGAALGGGWELALSCHARFALTQRTQVGLPEVTLGLLPGAGGITRTVRRFPMNEALNYLCRGKVHKAAKALELNWLDGTADSAEELINLATHWIDAHPAHQQPWDRNDFTFPSALSADEQGQWTRTTSKQDGGRDPAPMSILETALASAQSSFAESETIETKALIDLVIGQVSTNRIQFWMDQTALDNGQQRPHGEKSPKTESVGIIGGGMMGRGIAEVCANATINVTLKDQTLEHAQRAIASIANHESITPTDRYDEFSECDWIIEAVFEDAALKYDVIAAASHAAPNTLMASNTSTLPITDLAKHHTAPAQFLGLHFFSPVPKMPLVEIIRGEHTADATLARAWDFVRQLGKTPIVVNDGCGFYTTRVFATYAAEGLAMLEEGHNAADIEAAAKAMGFPIGPLAVTDEISLPLMQAIQHSINSTRKAPALAGGQMLSQMIENNRTGRAGGKGFYDYPAIGKKTLADDNEIKSDDSQKPSADLNELGERLWMIQSIETLRCMEEGIITNVPAANVGAVLGIGFPKWMGGTVQAINAMGLNMFRERTGQYRNSFGERYRMPDSFVELSGSYNTIDHSNWDA